MHFEDVALQWHSGQLFVMRECKGTMPVVMWRKDENREVLLVARCWSWQFRHLYGLVFLGDRRSIHRRFSLANSFPSTSDSRKSSQRKKAEGLFQSLLGFCWDFWFLFCFFLVFCSERIQIWTHQCFFGGIHGEGPIAPSCCVGDGRETSPQNAISVEEFARCFGHFCGNVRVAPRCDESVQVEWVGPVDSYGFFKREISGDWKFRVPLFWFELFWSQLQFAWHAFSCEKYVIVLRIVEENSSASPAIIDKLYGCSRAIFIHLCWLSSNLDIALGMQFGWLLFETSAPPPPKKVVFHQWCTSEASPTYHVVHGIDGYIFRDPMMKNPGSCLPRIPRTQQNELCHKFVGNRLIPTLTIQKQPKR